MQIEGPTKQRELRTIEHDCDLCIVGGGLAGTCAAITAARAGLKVVLIQDRPVLGGNASSEVRLWSLGATVHMGTNNRWAREGGVINEIMVENTFRNREGNPLLFDALLLEKVVEEPGITLLLNTSVFEADKHPGHPDRIASVRGYCSQNSTMYRVHAPLFCDSSGDGVLGFLSGAAFRIGAEAREEFDEGFAPAGEFGHLLGHSIYFYSKDIGRPVKFVAPSWALKDVPGRIPRHKRFNAREHGCKLWWIEYGGRLDTIHDTEAIKWELWKVVYGVWDYIKNSGAFPEAANMTLEWVGHIPGKRESRRFEGPYMLRQQDVVQRRVFEDAVAFGGWSIDLHPADGVFAEYEGSHHLYSKGIYTIAYRCLFSRNIDNLFLAGRIISASHVAFGSTRVMCTCAHGGQAVGMAAAICTDEQCLPGELTADPVRVKRLQRELMRTGQHIPGYALEDPDDLVQQAHIQASSELLLDHLPADGPRITLDRDRAQMLPLTAGPMPRVRLTVDAASPTTLTVTLYTTSDERHHCPDVELTRRSLSLDAGDNQPIELDFTDVTLKRDGYVFLALSRNDQVAVHGTNLRVTGLLTVKNLSDHHALDQSGVGGENFASWTPDRRPMGHNFALALDPPTCIGPAGHVRNGVQRPTHQTNAWIARYDDATPELTCRWDQPHSIQRIELAFDVDYDHAMETVFMGHPEDAMPFCVRRFELCNDAGQVVHRCEDHHQARCRIVLDKPVRTRSLTLKLLDTWEPGITPPSVFELRCYERA